MVTRRGFLGSVVALGVAPVIDLRIGSVSAPELIEFIFDESDGGWLIGRMKIPFGGGVGYRFVRIAAGSIDDQFARKAITDGLMWSAARGN